MSKLLQQPSPIQSAVLLTPKQRIAHYGVLLAFIAVNCILFTQGIYWFTLVPVVLFLGWLTMYHPHKVMFFIAFATPLSVKYTFERFGLSLSVPTEPFLILLTGLFWLKLFLDGDYDARIVRHPITIVIILNMVWILATSLTSTMPIVSIKFFISRTWFVTVFFFMAVPLFKDMKNVRTFFWLVPVALCFAIFYTWSRHLAHGMSQDFANKAAWPLFTDHGVYSATICFFVPIMLFFFWKPLVFRLKIWQQILAGAITLILTAAVVFSYARAAWIGLAASAGLFIIMMLGIRLRTILIGLALLAGVALYFQTDIYFKLKDNKEVSNSNFEEHIGSMYNISSDASNMERIDRWKSAWRMFKQKPVMGWGPGTYMFKYAPFQLSSEMTIISTNMGTLGNAHSEYIGPLAESGLLGMLLVFALLFVSLHKAMQLVYYSRDKMVRYTALAVMMGLISYFAHCMLNDYLDTDKASIPFWGFMAVLTALDIYHNREEETEEENLLPAKNINSQTKVV